MTALTGNLKVKLNMDQIENSEVQLKMAQIKNLKDQRKMTQIDNLRAHFMMHYIEYLEVHFQKAKLVSSRNLLLMDRELFIVNQSYMLLMTELVNQRDLLKVGYFRWLRYRDDSSYRELDRPTFDCSCRELDRPTFDCSDREIKETYF